MSDGNANVRRWLGLIVGLGLLTPFWFYAAFVLSAGCAMLGGTAGAAIGASALVVTAAVLVWCWDPELRNPPRRGVTAVMICLSVALGGALAVDIAHQLSDPGWKSF